VTGDRCRLLFLRPDGAKPAPCTKNLHVKGGDVLHRAPASRPGGARTQAPTQARSHAARCRPCRVSHPGGTRPARAPEGRAPRGAPPAPRRDALPGSPPARCRARLRRAPGHVASRTPEGRAPRHPPRPALTLPPVGHASGVPPAVPRAPLPPVGHASGVCLRLCRVSRPGGTRTQAPTQARSHAARCRPHLRHASGHAACTTRETLPIGKAVPRAPHARRRRSGRCSPAHTCAPEGHAPSSRARARATRPPALF